MSKSEKTRQHIIEKTAPVFNAKGYAGTSLSDLTEVTGLTKGAIYGHFRNKDEVAVAAFDYNFGNITAYVAERIRNQQHAVDRLLVYPKIYRNFLKIPFLSSGCPLLNTATDADDTHPGLKKRAADAMRFWKQSVEQLVKRGMERGEIRSHTDPVKVAVLLMSLIEGAVLQAKLTDRSQELAISMDFLEQYLEGLRT